MIGDYPMRKFEQRIYDVEIMKAILDRIDFVEIAANDGDYPYVVPTNFGYDFKDGKFLVYVHGAGEGHKLDLWARNNKVTVTFAMFQNHPHTKYRGAIHDYRCIMANGIIRPVDRETETDLWGHAVQRTLSHHFRYPNEFSVPHYMFMKMFIIECDMKNVSCKSEQPVYTPEDVPFPSLEELLYNAPGKPDFDHRPSIVSKPYEIAPRGSAPYRAASEELSCEELAPGSYTFSFAWSAPADGSVDADLYAYVREADGGIRRRYCMVFYKQLKDLYRALEHGGDDMQAEAGRESVIADLKALPENAAEILFVLAMHEPEKSGLDLSEIGGVTLGVEGEGAGELVRSIGVDGAGKRAAVYARLYRDGEGWRLEKGDGRGLGSWRIDDIAAELGLKKWKE